MLWDFFFLFLSSATMILIEDIETEGGFRNCGHFHKMRLPPLEPRTASQNRALYGSVNKSCAPMFQSHYLFSLMLLRRESRPSFPS